MISYKNGKLSSKSLFFSPTLLVSPVRVDFYGTTCAATF